MSWSVSAAGADFSGAAVSVTKNGRPVTATRYPTGELYGVESLVFSVSGVTEPALGTVDAYRVSVTGVRGARGSAHTYEVKLYRVPEVKMSDALNVDVVPGGKLAVGKSLLHGVAGVSPPGAKVTRQWLAGGEAIAGATGPVLRLTAQLECVPIGIRLTGTYPGAVPVTKTFSDVGEWEGCRAPTGLNLPGRGTVSTPFASLTLFPDVNGDGYGEIVAVDQASKLVIYPFARGSTLGQAGRMGYTFAGHRLHAAGDWNRDGQPDLMTLTSTNDLWLYPGRGGGRIGAGQKIGHGWGGYQLVPAGDLTGDGAPDALGVDPKGYLWVYPNDGRGAFASRFRTGHGWTGLRLYAAGDANGDGRHDILMVNPRGDLYFYAGLGGGRFGMGKKVGNGWNSYELIAGTDVTGDALADIVGRSPAGKLFLYRGLGSGKFATAKQIGNGW
jgi:hypothetical protein